MNIGPRRVGAGEPTFVIAEVGINHGGRMEQAERLIAAATRAGADAVKFQTYITEKRVPKDSPIFGILKQAELSFENQAALKALADAEGILFFSTPFDTDSVDFLAEIGVPALKVASFDLVNLQLLRRVAATGIPVIASRGMADRDEIDRAVSVVESAGVPYALLHCISGYPTPRESANLRVIQELRAGYRCPVGYSDHTLGIEVPVLAVAAGAELIEKHFTLDKGAEGPDHALSADLEELSALVAAIRDLEAVLGESAFKVYDAEKGTLAYRRPTA